MAERDSGATLIGRVLIGIAIAGGAIAMSAGVVAADDEAETADASTVTEVPPTLLGTAASMPEASESAVDGSSTDTVSSVQPITGPATVNTSPTTTSSVPTTSETTSTTSISPVPTTPDATVTTPVAGPVPTVLSAASDDVDTDSSIVALPAIELEQTGTQTATALATDLPATGSEQQWLALVATIALLAGVSMVAVSRRTA